MELEESVTEWFGRLRLDRDEVASQRLYERYVERLTAVARGKLSGTSRRVTDEEDIAAIVLSNLFEGIREGRFPQLKDRHDLWQVLLMLVDRRTKDQRRRNLAQKRGSGTIVGESAFFALGGKDSMHAGFQQFSGREPTPDYAAETKEELQRRLVQLDRPELRQIAIWKMEGRNNEEIAQLLGCVPRTVERRLELIRRVWESGK